MNILIVCAVFLCFEGIEEVPGLVKKLTQYAQTC